MRTNARRRRRGWVAQSVRERAGGWRAACGVGLAAGLMSGLVGGLAGSLVTGAAHAEAARAAEVARPVDRAGAPTSPIAQAAAAAPIAPAVKRALHFDVFLDERPIGFQRFELRPAADGLIVEIRARFELTLLRIKALDYDHRNREQWRGGCLESIESKTRQNGKDYRVSGRADAGQFTVEGEAGRQRLAACIGTFSYWDKQQLVRRKQLLNSQTGEYLPVSIRPIGAGSLRLGDRELDVDRYRIEGEDLDITLAYTRDGSEWVGLDSPLFAGRTLRYRRRAADLVEPASGAVAPSASPAASSPSSSSSTSSSTPPPAPPPPSPSPSPTPVD